MPISTGGVVVEKILAPSALGERGWRVGGEGGGERRRVGEKKEVSRRAEEGVNRKRTNHEQEDPSQLSGQRVSWRSLSLLSRVL